eukprot:4036021-Amphidinium_carterae.1
MVHKNGTEKKLAMHRAYLEVMLRCLMPSYEKDIVGVLQQLDHSQQFILRHLSDRAEFYEQYRL